MTFGVFFYFFNIVIRCWLVEEKLFIIIMRLFFWTGRENPEMTPPAHGGVKGSERLLMTKNPARSFSCLRCQVYGISFERFSRPWQTVGVASSPFHCADLSLAFLKEWSPLSELPSLVLVRVTLGLSDMSGSTCIAQRSQKSSSPTTTTTWGHSRQGLWDPFRSNW